MTQVISSQSGSEVVNYLPASILFERFWLGKDKNSQTGAAIGYGFELHSGKSERRQLHHLPARSLPIKAVFRYSRG